MSQFYIVNESTEDTFESTDNLEDAVRVAREVQESHPRLASEFGRLADIL